MNSPSCSTFANVSAQFWSPEPGDLPDLPDLTDLSVVARGGYTVVYRAVQVSANREVALRIDKRPFAQPEQRRRFEQEVRAASRLSGHPNVVDLYFAGVTDDGRPYVVMELCEGSYADRLDAEGSIPDSEVRAIGIQLADALHQAHDKGVLHRDIKPANILIRPDGTPLLADFGLALVTDSQPQADVHATIGHLTPAYAPLETLQMKPASQFSDVYSLAATLYALLAGHPPRFTGEVTDLREVMELFGRPIPDVAGASALLVGMLRAAMTSNPDGRPTADQFREMLDSVPLAAPPAAYTSRRPSPRSDNARTQGLRTVAPGAAAPGTAPAPAAPPHAPAPVATAPPAAAAPVVPAPAPPMPGPPPPPASRPRAEPEAYRSGEHRIAPPPGDSPFAPPGTPSSTHPAPPVPPQPARPYEPHPVSDTGSRRYPEPDAGTRYPGAEPTRAFPAPAPPPGDAPQFADAPYADAPPPAFPPEPPGPQYPGPPPEPSPQERSRLRIPGKELVRSRLDRRRGEEGDGGRAKFFIVSGAVILVVLVLITWGVVALFSGGDDAEDSGDTPQGGAAPACAFTAEGVSCLPEPKCYNNFSISQDGEAAAQDTGCDGEHEWEAYAQGDLPENVTSPAYKDVTSVEVVKNACRGKEVLKQIVGVTDLETWISDVLPPSAQAFQGGDRTFYCIARKQDQTMTGPTFTTK